MALPQARDTAPSIIDARSRLSNQELGYLPNRIEDARAYDYIHYDKAIEDAVVRVYLAVDHTKGKSLQYLLGAFTHGLLETGRYGKVEVHMHDIWSTRGQERTFHGYSLQHMYQRASLVTQRGFTAEAGRLISLDETDDVGSERDSKQVQIAYERVVTQQMSQAMRGIFDQILSTANAVHFTRAEPLQQLIARCRDPASSDFSTIHPDDQVTANAEAAYLHMRAMGSLNSGRFEEILDTLTQYKKGMFEGAQDDTIPCIVSIPINAVRQSMVELTPLPPADGPKEAAYVSDFLSKKLKGMPNSMTWEVLRGERGQPERTIDRGLSDGDVAKVVDQAVGRGTEYHGYKIGPTHLCMPVPTIMAHAAEGARTVRIELNRQRSNILIYDTLPAIHADGEVPAGTIHVLDYSHGTAPTPVRLDVHALFQHANIVDPRDFVRYRVGSTEDIIRGQGHQATGPFSQLYENSFSTVDPALLDACSEILNRAPGANVMTVGERLAMIVAVAALEESNEVGLASGMRGCSAYIQELGRALATARTLTDPGMDTYALAMAAPLSAFVDITGIETMPGGGQGYREIHHGLLPNVHLSADVLDDLEGADTRSTMQKLMFVCAAARVTLRPGGVRQPSLERCMDTQYMVQCLQDDAVLRILQMFTAGAALHINNTETAPRIGFIAATGQMPPASFLELSAAVARRMLEMYCANTPQMQVERAARAASRKAMDLMRTQHWWFMKYLMSRALTSDSVAQFNLHSLPVPFDFTILRLLRAQVSHAIVTTRGGAWLDIGKVTPRVVEQRATLWRKMMWSTRFFPFILPKHTHVFPGVAVADPKHGNTATMNYEQFMRQASNPRNIGDKHATVMSFLPGYGLNSRTEFDSSVGTQLDPTSYPCHSLMKDRQEKLFRTPYYGYKYQRCVPNMQQQLETHMFFNTQLWRGPEISDAHIKTFSNLLQKNNCVPLMAFRSEAFATAVSTQPSLSSVLPTMARTTQRVYADRPNPTPRGMVVSTSVPGAVSVTPP